VALSVRGALVSGGLVPLLAGWVHPGADPILLREAAWLLALLRTEGGGEHREAVTEEAASLPAFVFALKNAGGARGYAKIYMYREVYMHRYTHTLLRTEGGGEHKQAVAREASVSSAFVCAIQQTGGAEKVTPIYGYI